MKILILSHSSELGGAERSMLDLFDYWHKQGLIEPHFIIREPLQKMTRELKDRGWPYYSMYYTNWSQRKPSRRPEDVFRNARENSKVVFRIEEIIEQLQPDVVMTNTIVSPWAAIAAHFKRAPHVWFVREYGDIDHRHIFELGREKMLQDIDSLSDLVVTNSNTLAEHVQEYVDKSKVATLYTPFDLKKLEQKAKEKAPNPFKHNDSLKLVITGRIAPSKGQAAAAEAVGILSEKGRNVELCVIGEPAEKEDSDELQSVIEAYKINGKVHLIGQQGNPLAVVKHADLGIMASKQEAFGRVTFEYMACGIGVVGAASGATPELIDDGVNGTLFTSSDNSAEELAEKLLQYITDKSLIEKHGLAAKQKAKNMMGGKNNADNLMEKILKAKGQQRHVPLNFSHRWLEYPTIAQQYIDDSRVISLKRLAYERGRGKVKGAYLLGMRIINKILGR